MTEGRRKKSILDGSGKGEGKERQLRIVTFRLPGLSLLDFVPRNGDPGILSIPRSDDDGRIVLKEAIDLPILWSLTYPPVVTAFDEVVEMGEIFEVKLDAWIATMEEGRWMRYRVKYVFQKTYSASVIKSNRGSSESRS